MVKETRSFLVLHYVLLIAVIFTTIGVIDRFIEGIPLWAGLIIAVALGLAYPRIVVSLGYGPAQWESTQQK